MRAFEIYVNGERLCLAGVGDKGVLSAIVDYVGRDRKGLHFHVGGLLMPQEEHVRWQDRHLGVGDEILVRIVEIDKVDTPKERFPIDPKEDIRMQKRYVRSMAREFGWKIETRRRRP